MSMETTSKPSGSIAVGTTTVFDGTAILTGVTLSAAAADCTITVYDNTAGSGTVVFYYVLDITVEGTSMYARMPSVKCSTGLTVVVTGTGALGEVYYK